MLERYREWFGSGVVEIERPDELTAETLAAATAATHAGVRKRRRCGLPGHLLRRRRFIGFADFIVRQPDGSLPGARHQARPPRAGHRAAAARRLRRAARADRHPGGADRRTAARRRHRQRAPGRATSCRSTGDAAPGCVQLVADRHARIRPRRLGRPALHRRAGAAPPATPRSTRTATCCWSPACAYCSASASRTPASPPSTSSRPPTPHPKTIAAQHLRVAARAGPAAAEGDGPTRRRRSSWPTRRTIAVHPRTESGRHLLRLRGRPALHRGRRRAAGASTTCSGWSRPTAPSRAFWAHDFAEETAALERLPRLRRRAPAQALPGHAHLPLRRLRAHPPAVHRRPARRRRGRRRRPAARPRARRPVPDRAQGRARRQPLLLDQEARAALHGRRPATGRRSPTPPTRSPST